MKKYIVIAATLLASYTAKAQANDIPIIGNKFTFGIDAGLAAPSGNFSSTTNSSSTSDINGFAKAGFHYDIYGGFKFSKFIGIMAQFGANSNSLNTAAIETPPGSSITSSGGYTTSEYLVGPYLSITIVKIKIEAKLLGGMLTNNYPTLTFSSYGSSIAQAVQSGSGFGYCAGAKIKYMMLGGMLGIGVGLNYVGSDIKYNGVSENGIAQPNSSAKMSVGLIQATLGASLDI